MTEYEIARKYCEMRDKAVADTIMNNNTEYIKQVFRYQGLPIPNERVLMCTACKCACNITGMPKRVVKRAKKWLYEHDYSPEIGED